MLRSILFVCGDEHARDVYGTALRRGGILPVFVDSVARALAFYQQVRVPLTVFHVEPDSSDSWGDCTRLLTADTPVVVLTAHVRAGRERRAAAASGWAAFIAEPCTPRELTDIVGRVLTGERDVVWPASLVLKAG